jgi:glucose/arabinose dehydrogenase
VLGQAPARSNTLLPQLLRGITVPLGFGASVFGTTPGFLPSSLTFGPDGRLYVATVTQGPDGQFISKGQILAFEDLGGVGGAPQIVAEGFHQLLGIVFGPDGTLYATDNDTVTFKGSVIALRDGNADGVYEQRRTVLMNIPNGRHQTNGMVFGPDGMMYLANGSATDDGLECGPPDGEPCGSQETKPWTGSIIRVNTAWENVDLQQDIRVDEDHAYAADGMDDESVSVSTGYRNIYDVDFSPADPSMIYTPMNGSDMPASNEPLYRTPVFDRKVVGQDAQGQPIFGPVIDDAGFPSCLYGAHPNNFPFPETNGGLGHQHPETFEPVDNPNSAVTDRFGRCQKDKVIRPIMFFRSAHNGTTGLAFERGNNFPARYDNDLFVGEWGSIWNLNGAVPTGHKITHIDIGPDGLPQRKREFMAGAIPMDVTFGPDGAMYVADMQGVIYRVVSVMDTPDTATVEITGEGGNAQFVPQIIAVPRGTSVLWVNLDDVAHNIHLQGRVLAEDQAQYQPYCVTDVNNCTDSINSPGVIPPRGSFRYDFGDLDGVWEYGSTANPTDAAMQGMVIVAPVDR